MIFLLGDLINWIRSFWEDRTFGVARNSGWNELRDRFIAANPLCALCGNKGKIVHHIFPVWKFPEKEMLWENLITGCAFCHLNFFHLGSYRSYEEDIKR